MASWIVLGLAIICELVGTILLKKLDSLARWYLAPPMLLSYLLSLGGLAYALRTIDVGIAYAVWAGVGTVSIAIVGMVCFGESISWVKVAGIALVVLGVIGLHLADAGAWNR